MFSKNRSGTELLLPLALHGTCVAVVPGSCFLSSTTALLNIALAFGITLFVVIFFTAPFSGDYLSVYLSAIQVFLYDMRNSV